MSTNGTDNRIWILIPLACFFSPEDSVVDVWNERLPDNDFEFLEPLLALRTSMLQTLVKVRREKCDAAEDRIYVAYAYKDLVTHLQMQAKIARQSFNPQV